jgi:membrane-associated phospholipid phosphatase
MRWPLAIALAALVALVAQTLALPRLATWDIEVAAAIRGLRSDGLDRAALVATHLAPWIAAGAALLAAGLAWRRGARADVARLVVAVVVGLLVIEALKLVIERDRPGSGPWLHGGASYPSGHVANAALLVGAAVRLLAAALRPRGVAARAARAARRHAVVVALLAGAGIGFVLAVAFTRVYLSRHWCTDTTAGMLVAVLVLAVADTLAAGRRAGAVGIGGAVAFAALLVAVTAGSRVRLTSPVPVQLRDSAPHRETGRPRMLCSAPSAQRPASAAATTSRASAWMRARCSELRKLSA